MPAGEFTMGSPRREAGRRANEAQRPVRLERRFRELALTVRAMTGRAVLGVPCAPLRDLVCGKRGREDDNPFVGGRASRRRQREDQRE